ncbi:MAG: hydroxymethylglutaryl-CoA synthase [Pseudomonadota bacterium]
MELAHARTNKTSAAGPARVGISGMASYLPPFSVELEDWCTWADDSWPKVNAVVGSAFRVRSPNENAYTMAATAVLRLIQRYDIDPASVGMLALGTESSTDNSAGAVLVRGMLDVALPELDLPPLARACEVPEFKHACLGGMYALKAAARYLQTDGYGRKAIVVCSDIAEYRRGSSGEPTQGAGAVAMLVDNDCDLLSFDVALSGSSSAYRGPDFRKPLSRFVGQGDSAFAQPRDFPVVNGKYSTTCYLEAALTAGKDLFARLEGSPARWMRQLAMVYLHRPYQRMADNGLAYLYLLALAQGDDADLTELAAMAEETGVDLATLQDELTGNTDLATLLAEGQLTAELYPATSAVAKRLLKSEVFSTLTTRHGSDSMRQVGNLYTASLPAWMAAGLEQAATATEDLTGRELLAAGYGSGDAAELMVMRFGPGWRSAARQLAFASDLGEATALDRETYERLHDGADVPTPVRSGVFVIDRIGDGSAAFDDTGIEYYRYLA